MVPRIVECSLSAHILAHRSRFINAAGPFHCEGARAQRRLKGPFRIPDVIALNVNKHAVLRETYGLPDFPNFSRCAVQDVELLSAVSA